MKLQLGVDEAGRGPVIGPLVMAGCLTNSTIDAQLKELGVKDVGVVFDSTVEYDAYQEKFGDEAAMNLKYEPKVDQPAKLLKEPGKFAGLKDAEGGMFEGHQLTLRRQSLQRGVLPHNVIAVNVPEHLRLQYKKCAVYPTFAGLRLLGELNYAVTVKFEMAVPGGGPHCSHCRQFSMCSMKC